MSYGVIVRNDAGYTQIDSEAPRLLKIHDGTYFGNPTVSVAFPFPITTAEPPCIFIRPDQGQNGVMYRSININGSPGAWTGFTIRLSNINFTASGTWFAAVFAATTTSDYGLRIWDASGNPIYDTGCPAVLVSSAANDWPYAGMTQLTIGAAYTWVCQMPRAIGPYDHLMINPFSRYLLSAHPSNSLMMGVTVDYANNRLVMYGVGFNAWTDIGQHAAVFARMRR